MPRPAIIAVRAVLIAIVVAIPAIAVWRAFGPARFPATQDFSLIDQSGRPFALSQERGKPVVLFFGYTHCPDICPTTLADLAHAKASLGPAAAGVAVLFVTVDPNRDTPIALKKYVALFDPSFIGLTGSAAQLAPVYNAYHVYHQIAPDKDGAGGYLVTHSAAVYFIDRDGRLRTIGDYTDGREQITRDLKEIVS